MSTLTLSSLSRAIVGTKPTATAAAMPLQASTLPAVAPAPAQVDTKAPAVAASKPVAEKVDVKPVVEKAETKAVDKSDTIAPASTTKKDDAMGKKEDLLEKARKAKEAADAAQRELDDFRESERSGVVARLRAEMEEYGITVEDLSARSAVERRAGKGVKRGPAQVKYADKASGAKWSGRGQKPRWLVTALADGKKLEDFAV